ncbi:hypothetical protein QFC22_006500 [Naganishia vaughanmartiniae]|uniref:Uncharacterized protein n=1 Tax=Naganishia vaughanmartiniae TaxID=1424756 RepID=A0ACC2WI90_9TREE|nr:hypothetical protein QFC22_006500 [Naganishia vaughanmartiniae]
MKFLVTSILGLSGLATLGSAIPIRIVTIDAVAPLSPSAIDVGYITHSPSSAAAAAAAVENGNENADRIGKSNNLAPGWLKEFMEKYAPTSTETDTYSHPHSHGYKWSTTAAHPHPHGGPNDHSLSAGTDVSRVTISEWMYAPPLSEVSPPPPSSEEDGPAGEMMLVTRPDGVVVYEFVPAVEAHGGGGCVFRYAVLSLPIFSSH